MLALERSAAPDATQLDFGLSPKVWNVGGFGGRDASPGLRGPVDWTSSALVDAAGSSTPEVFAYLNGASWPFDSVEIDLAGYAAYVQSGDPEPLRDLLPRSVANDGAVHGYDPSLDLVFYGYLGVGPGATEAALQRRATEVVVAAGAGREVQTALRRLYLSRSGTTSGLHWDGRTTSLVQLSGTKAGILFRPKDRQFLDPFPSPDGPNSGVDPFDRQCDLGSATPLEVVLTPGDVLEIPLGWWHCFRSTSVESTSLSIWW